MIFYFDTYFSRTNIIIENVLQKCPLSFFGVEMRENVIIVLLINIKKMQF